MADSVKIIKKLTDTFHTILAGPYNNDQRITQLEDLKKQANSFKSKYDCNKNISKNIDDFNANLDAVIKNPDAYASMAQLSRYKPPLEENIELEFDIGDPYAYGRFDFDDQTIQKKANELINSIMNEMK